MAMNYREGDLILNPSCGISSEWLDVESFFSLSSTVFFFLFAELRNTSAPEGLDHYRSVEIV